MQPSGSQGAFARALLDRVAPPAALRLAGDAETLARRFGVYRNNIYASLTNVLEARFPACVSLLGEEFFRGMAAAFVSAHPPRSPVMLEYGAEFPAFVADFKPAQDFPYVADVARLEWAMHTALHATDAEPAAISALHALDAARLAEVQIVLHPAARIVASGYPVLSILRAATDPSASESAEFSGAETVLVTRPELDVGVQTISLGALAFLDTVARGGALGPAVEAAFAIEPGFDAAQTLALIFTAGAIATVHLPTAN